MPIRVYSEAAGLEACFVEVDERWSIRELNRIYESRDAWLELFRRKVTGKGEIRSRTRRNTVHADDDGFRHGP